MGKKKNKRKTQGIIINNDDSKPISFKKTCDTIASKRSDVSINEIAIQPPPKSSHNDIATTNTLGTVTSNNICAAVNSSSSNIVSSSPPTPYRDDAKLYTHTTTYQCAIGNLCIPCAYKVGCFDVAKDKEFTTRVPNVRPEACPRSKSNYNNYRNSKDGMVYGYQYNKAMKVLTVGDGDFTFSLALARILFSPFSSDNSGSHDRNQIQNKTNNGCTKSRLVATSYETRETLQEVYPNIDKTIKELKELGAEVYFEVDATRLVSTLQNHNNEITKSKFHRIIWNFPCSAEPGGRDGQRSEMELNQQLIRDFVRNATVDLLDIRNNGEIHMTHKTKPPFHLWNLSSVALEGLLAGGDCVGDGDNSSTSTSLLEFKGRVVFDRCLLPPYTPRKALDKKSFTCHDACVYIFGATKFITEATDDDDGADFNTTGEKCARGKEIGYSRQKEELSINCTIPTSFHDPLDSIVPVNENMLRKIRQSHLVNAIKRKHQRDIASHGGKLSRSKKKRLRVS